MVFSDVEIRRYLDEGKIKIAPPLPPEQFGSCSVDFRLGNELSIFEHSRHAFIDPKERTAIQDLMPTMTVATGEPFILQPREFALAITEETLDSRRRRGVRICSSTFEQLSSRVAVPYRKNVGNKYVGQGRPLSSKLASETGG
jgi:dCTP deaminase